MSRERPLTTASAVFAHPLFGSKPRRTAVGVGYLVLAAGVVGLSALLRQTLFLGGGPDQLQGLAIVFAVASVGVALVYAAWNGGPALAAAIPLAPASVGALASRHLVLEVDLVLALAAGAAGAGIATYAAGVHSSGIWRPEPYPGLTDALAVATPIAILAAVSLQQTAPYVGPHAREGVILAGVLLGIGILALGLQWAVWMLAARRTW